MTGKLKTIEEQAEALRYAAESEEFSGLALADFQDAVSIEKSSYPKKFKYFAHRDNVKEIQEYFDDSGINCEVIEIPIMPSYWPHTGTLLDELILIVAKIYKKQH